MHPAHPLVRPRLAALATLTALAALSTVGAPGSARAAAIVGDPLVPTVTCADATQPASGGTLAWAGGAATTTPTVSYVDSTGVETAAGALDCSGGVFGEAVERKKKKGDTDILIVKMNDVLISSYRADTSGDGPLVVDVDTVLAGVVDGVQLFEHRFDLQLRSVLFDSAGAVAGRSTQYLGLDYLSADPSAAAGTWSFDARTGMLVFTAALQDVPGAVALRSAPVQAVPEPGTLALLGVALAVAALLRRRRRYGAPPPVAARPPAWAPRAA
jgi:hypothetical protein